MRVYHGTSGKVAKDILENGIKPRGDSSSNWRHASGSDRVYVSTVYAPYFAVHATPDEAGALSGIVEIDLGKIPRSAMLPDEDWCEQVDRRNELFSSPELVSMGGDMGRRTEWFRDNIDRFSDHAFISLRDMGVMAIRGGVPKEAVTRISVYNPLRNITAVHAAMDPAITLMNHALMHDKYEALTKWFMGEFVDLVWAKQFMSVGGMCTAQNGPELSSVVRRFSRRHVTIMWA